MLITTKEAWIFNLHSIGERGKTFKSYVHPDCQFIVGQGFGLHFAGETGIPVANSIPLNSECLDPALHRTMQNDPHCANFGNEQIIARREQLETRLLEGETSVPTVSPKTRVAWLFARLHSTKESPESQINSLLNILQNLRMDTRPFGMISFPKGEQFIRVVQRKGFLFLLPGVFTSGQRLIEYPTTKFQRPIEFGALALGRLEAILESLHLHSLLIFNVLFQDCNRCTPNCRDKIRMCPQGRQSAFHLWKFLTKQTRTATLDPLHKFMDTKLRINFTKDMHVIRHYFKFQDVARQFFCNLIDDLFQAFVHTANKHLAAILRTKDNMVFTGV